MTTDSDSECSYVANLADFNVIRVIIIVIVIKIIVIKIIYTNVSHTLQLSSCKLLTLPKPMAIVSCVVVICF